MVELLSKSAKPLALKQRTSSVDLRRDYTSQTWISVVGLLKFREFLITVDHFSIWKRHLAWACDDGKKLRNYMTQQYESNMLFMSLLLSTELCILFNDSTVQTKVIECLMQERIESMEFWAGITIIVSCILTLMSLVATFAAWTMVSAVSDVNTHCILRSSIGQYVVELPGRFIVGSIYTFTIWMTLFINILMPGILWPFLLGAFVVVCFVHTITAFSAFGRIVMHTGAMGDRPIFDPTYEDNQSPHSLHQDLLAKAEATLMNGTSIRRLYGNHLRPIDRKMTVAELSHHLKSQDSDLSSRGSVVSCERKEDHEASLSEKTHQRTGSIVKFAEGSIIYDTSGEQVSSPVDGKGAMRTDQDGVNASTGILKSDAIPHDERQTLLPPLYPIMINSDSVKIHPENRNERMKQSSEDFLHALHLLNSSEYTESSSFRDNFLNPSLNSRRNGAGFDRSKVEIITPSEIGSPPRQVSALSSSLVSSLGHYIDDDITDFHGLCLSPSESKYDNVDPLSTHETVDNEINTTMLVWSLSSEESSQDETGKNSRLWNQPVINPHHNNDLVMREARTMGHKKRRASRHRVPFKQSGSSEEDGKPFYTDEEQQSLLCDNMESGVYGSVHRDDRRNRKGHG